MRCCWLSQACSLQTPRDGRNTPVCLGWMFWEGLHHRLRSINNSNASTAARMPPKCKRHINPVTPFLAFHSAVVSLLAKSTQKQSKQWKPFFFISTAGAQISREIVFNILSPSFTEEMLPHFLCALVLQKVRPACAYLLLVICYSDVSSFKGPISVLLW